MPSGALGAIDASARPRSWRTCGPRRLRGQSMPALLATQSENADVERSVLWTRLVWRCKQP
jgi:hypothetical protein